MIELSALHIPLDAARKTVRDSAERRFATLAEQASLTVELYKPIRQDIQQPHDRDECYVILDGTGKFEMGDDQIIFAPGDFLFVPAFMPHRFVDFGESMTCWVIFYGPIGGEQITQ